MCDLTIEDIHKIREENYLKTKAMTDEEIIKYTKENAVSVLVRLKNVKRIEVNA